MTFQGRVVDSSHLGVLGQEVDYLQGILHMTLNTQTQCLDTLQENESVEG